MANSEADINKIELQTVMLDYMLLSSLWIPSACVCEGKLNPVQQRQSNNKKSYLKKLFTEFKCNKWLLNFKK